MEVRQQLALPHWKECCGTVALWLSVRVALRSVAPCQETHGQSLPNAISNHRRIRTQHHQTHSADTKYEYCTTLTETEVHRRVSSLLHSDRDEIL